MTDETEKIVQQTVTALDDRANGLDAATQSRLTQARYSALAAAYRRPFLSRYGTVLGSATAAAVVAAVLWLIPAIEAPDPDALLTEFEIEAIGEDLELVEDLDFFDWLETEQARAGKA